jgi:hypothetical protein
MMNIYEVIDAFADGERVNPGALKQALSTDAGRQYLIDIVALREVAGQDIPVAPVGTRASQGAARWLALAAGLAFAVIGGYQAGMSRGAADAAGALPPAVMSEKAPPVPTVVIKLEPGTTWRDPAKGGQP